MPNQGSIRFSCDIEDDTMKTIKWLLNPLMIWGAVLGCCIFGSVGMLRDAARHRGRGYVWYEQPDRLEKVSENQYKRERYIGALLILSVAIWLWVITARNARDRDAEKPLRSVE